ncbi:MAG: O-antigen ligase family protein [Caldisericia bacterium]
MVDFGSILFSLLAVLSFPIKPILSLSFTLPLFFYYFPENLPLFLIPLYPLLDFFIRRGVPSVSSIWDEGFIILLFLIIFLRLKKKEIKFTSLIIPVLIFLIFLLFSTYFSSIDYRVAVDGIRSYLEMFLFFLIIINYVEDKKMLNILLDIASFSLLVISLYGIYQFIFKVSIPAAWIDKDLETSISTRAFSIFGSPNALAGYLILLIPIFFMLFLDEKKTFKKLYYIFVVLVSLLALLFTLSRAAQLSIIIAFMIFTLLYKDKRYFLVIILLLLALISVPQIRTRFLNLISPVYLEKAKTYGRIYRWNLALSIFSLHPFSGVGPGGFGGAVASKLGMFEGLYVDNYYLKTLVETGIFGLLSFLYLIFSILKKGISNMIKLFDEKSKNLSLGIFLGISAFLMNNFTENLWEIPVLSVTLWTLVSFLFILSKKND